MKINLILSRSNYTSFHQSAFIDVISDHFNVVYIEDQIPDKRKSLIVSNLTKDRWYMDLYQQGYPLVVDLLWGGSKFDLPNVLLLTNLNWFWYHESLLYKKSDYDQYTPNRNYTKLALMPMGLQKPNYDLLFDHIQEYLDIFHWSYIERTGKYLPNDLPPGWPAQTGSTGQQQRYFNPTWYDDTYFSLVAETTADEHLPLHLTEKTFKPIAFQHPFLLWAQPGVLSHLRSQGFETFDNLFDELYDQEFNNIKRLNLILNNIKQFKRSEYDQLTLNKIQHNYQKFFDHDQIKTRINQEIVNPIKEFFEKTRHS